MKKAKEYAKEYLEAEDKDKLRAAMKAWKEMFFEFEEIKNARNAKTDAAAVAIVRELNQKWNAFALRTNGEIKRDGFIVMLHELYPDLYAGLKRAGL